jgi:hypothetical protein
MKSVPARLAGHLRRNAAAWIGLGALFWLSWTLTGTGCAVHSTVGLPCPGCGLTRACLAALRGDLALAFRLHPLFWLAPLILIVVVVLLTFAPERLSTRTANRWWLGLALLFLSVYLVRMVFYFPDQDPLVWNDRAVLPRIWQGLRALARALTGQ